MITADVAQSLDDIKWSASGTHDDGPKRSASGQHDHYGQYACDKNGFVHPTVILEIVEIIIDEVNYESSQQISDDDIRYERETFV